MNAKMRDIRFWPLGLIVALTMLLSACGGGGARESIMFDAAAAVLLGGTSLRGGAGGVVGTAIGVLFLGVLSNGLAVAGVPSFWQQIISGFILATAAIADQVQRGGFGIRLRRRTTANAVPVGE